MSQVSVLFVCLGNICRSPTAEGVFNNKLIQANLNGCIQSGSAGTSDWHIGSPPDRRTLNAALTRGYDFSNQRGRQVKVDDFSNFDLVLAMDQENLSHLDLMKPKGFSGHLGLFLDFAVNSEYSEVPDPYYGGDTGFDLVLDLCESASEGLIAHIQTSLLS
ncbi:MAG: low molecular weight phosphotyrosine protein phosphatase [Agarilytica sp.]